MLWSDSLSGERYLTCFTCDTSLSAQEERCSDEATARRYLGEADWDLDRAMSSYMPPIPESPLSGRTFATSEYLRNYREIEAPDGPMEMGVILNTLLEKYCGHEDIPWKEEGKPFFKALQEEAMANAQELIGQIPEAAQRMWTSALQLRGREFCFILNAAVRSDDPELVEATAQLTRAINKLCVTAGGPGPARAPRAVHPPGNLCFRGGGFDDRYRSFFVKGRCFRQPTYLATSFSRDVAMRFLRRASTASKVRQQPTFNRKLFY
jgi:hypothetical protein